MVLLQNVLLLLHLRPDMMLLPTTLGGAISGNKVTGKVYKDITPNKSNMIETTVDNTGRSINLFSIENKSF